jgi:hypothetical protein
MILPSKHLPETRSLVGIGAEILGQLQEPRAVSELWERVRRARGPMPLSYDAFVLSLTFLHMVFAVEQTSGLIQITQPDR